MKLPLGALMFAATLMGSGQVSAQEFHGYPCTQDCSGHEAGYEWAARKGIDSIDDCGGNSNSFIEGCQAFVEGNTDSSAADDTGGLPSEDGESSE